MAESPILAARCPVEWHSQIQDIAKAASRKEAEVVREAIAQYLGKTNPSSVKGAIALPRGENRGIGAKASRMGAGEPK